MESYGMNIKNCSQSFSFQNDHVFHEKFMDEEIPERKSF
jgi:hypothetical protein